MSQTIYDKYGFETISQVVHDFYGRVLKSAITAPYFVGTDMQKLINHQTQFLCFLFGGPIQYEGGELSKMHQRLDITNEAFSEIADLLEETMEDHDFMEADCELAMNAIFEHKSVIVKTSNE